MKEYEMIKSNFIKFKTLRITNNETTNYLYSITLPKVLTKSI